MPKRPRLQNLLRLCLLLFTWAALGDAHAMAEVDAPAPPLKGRFFDGRPVDLAQLRGKVVLVNYYSSYCKFCALEIGVLEAFYEERRAQGFEIIMVGVDAPEDRPRVERMLGIYNLPGTMWHELAENGFGPRDVTPRGFLIDRNGVLRDKSKGAKTPKYLREVILPLLEAR
jgi:thiol-disulfide isomerase/thioredoxin